MIPVENVADIMGHLRDMPQSEVKRKLSEMETERHRFTFQVIVCSPSRVRKKGWEAMV